MFTLSWQPPYDWSWMLGFLAARAVDGVETVGEGFYARSLVVGEHRGLVSVRAHLPTHTVQVSVSAGLLPVAPACLAKVSRLFDLDCQPAQVAAVLGSLGEDRPGLRLPGSVDTFEQGVRAILGQLVSVAMAARLTAKVARRRILSRALKIYKHFRELAAGRRTISPCAVGRQKISFYPMIT